MHDIHLPKTCLLQESGENGNRNSTQGEPQTDQLEERNFHQKRLREEGCGSSSAVMDAGKGGAAATSGDAIEKPALTNMEHLSELEKLKTM